MRDITKMIEEIDGEEDIVRKSELGIALNNSANNSTLGEPEEDIFNKKWINNNLNKIN